jgi:tRNA1(Val) A37 N6-methylase TrmN6
LAVAISWSERGSGLGSGNGLLNLLLTKNHVELELGVSTGAEMFGMIARNLATRELDMRRVMGA